MEEGREGGERREKERGRNNRRKEGVCVWGGTFWRFKMVRPCRTCPPVAANIPPPIGPGSPAAAWAREQLRRGSICSPVAIASPP